MALTSAQIRAARGLLDWTAKDLADRIGIKPSSMSAIENGQSKGSVQTIEAIEMALLAGGVEFLPGDGVRRQHSLVVRMEGANGFKEFLNDVYETARDVGGDICLHNAKPANWHRWAGAEWYEAHKKRMVSVKDNYTFRVTAIEGEDLLIGSSFAEYRWIPKEMFNERGFYCYGSKLAFLDFSSDNIQIFILNQQEFADGFRGMFNITWDNVAKPIASSK